MTRLTLIYSQAGSGTHDELEDAFGLHIVAGGSITAADAERAIRLYTQQAGAPLA